MEQLDIAVKNVTDQLPAVRAMCEECCVDMVRRLLDVMEVSEVHELVDRVKYEDFAKGEIASYHSMQVWGDDDDGLPF